MVNELSVNSTTENLSLIRDFIKNNAIDVGFNEDSIGKITLAVDEACTNIIKHAYKYEISGQINITVNFSNQKFTVTIVDNGSHFNPAVIPDPDLKIYHQQRKTGGLGMFLMKKLMDEVNYENLEDNRNQVVLVKYLS
ncbi:MAG: ATP-binding protein [bacterium]